ncbi:hypothetical protein [Variovorax sp. Root318D1]|uniref:hypothetical protein n=1 Tax=Variovorax sp. Root318D1 TaxID=1736513 RepID=UPI0012FB51E5|nr:hypothetical protein [Variovorax sp. Root318D1]
MLIFQLTIDRLIDGLAGRPGSGYDRQRSRLLVPIASSESNATRLHAALPNMIHRFHLPC